MYFGIYYSLDKIIKFLFKNTKKELYVLFYGLVLLINGKIMTDGTI